MEANGWTLYLHPLFQQQLEKLTALVETLQAKDPLRYKEQSATKLLTTINCHMREIIPRDPNAAEFRQGNTLGADNRQWFRAKFHERYRLFFRFSSKEKVIVYAWVNDESTLRKAGSSYQLSVQKPLAISGQRAAHIDQESSTAGSLRNTDD
jgi:toxin YhaV